MRFACILRAPVLFLLLLASAAQAEPLATDANLVTAIDVSGSIDPATEALEFDGIAAAVEHPASLRPSPAAITAGSASPRSPGRATAIS
jgi:membrane-bound ClpP family serine protease